MAVADYLGNNEKLFPAEQLFCVGKSVDYKRRQVGRLWGEIHQKAGRRLTKPEGFVVCRA